MFEVYPAIDGWRWHFVADNGEVMASGEAYANKSNAMRAVRSLKRQVYRAPISESGGYHPA